MTRSEGRWLALVALCAAVVAFGVIVFMLLCQAGYAGLYAGLYATGRKAAADGAPRD